MARILRVMARRAVSFLVAPLVAFVLAGCNFYTPFESRDPWRTEAEERCLAEGLVQKTAFVEPANDGNGYGACGMSHPFKVMAMNRGEVTVQPKATLACPLISSVDRWIAEAVQPAAQTWFGEEVVEIKQISSYACRSMNNQAGASISEHAFGNAIDIAAFRFASGREVTVERGWRGAPDERGFLHQIQAAACERFSTVLAPGSDPFHYNHFHLDLARRASGRGVCKPEPQEVMPPQSPYDRQGIPMVRQAPPRGPAVVNYDPAPRSTLAARDYQDDLQARTARSLNGPNVPPPGEPLSLAPPPAGNYSPPPPGNYAPPPPNYVRAPAANGLVPPASIPNVRRGDGYVTGSVKPAAKPKAED
jgi:extensin-like protein